LDQIVLRSEKTPFWPLCKRNYIYAVFPGSTKIEFFMGVLLTFVAFLMYF